MAAERDITPAAISKQAKALGLPNRRLKSKDAKIIAQTEQQEKKEEEKYPQPSKKKQGLHACRRANCRRPGMYKATITTRYVTNDKWSGWFCFRHLIAVLPVQIRGMKKADYIVIRRFTPNE